MNDMGTFTTYRFMSMFCLDYLSWVMQFNYQLQVRYLPDSVQYMNTSNISVRFHPVANRSCIHYLKDLISETIHEVFLQALLLSIDRDVRLYNSYYYISISNGIHCEFNQERYTFFSTTITSNLTNTISLYNFMEFQGPLVYFRSMYYSITISSPLMKQCDVVLNFQLVFEDKTTASQGQCSSSYTQVCR